MKFDSEIVEEIREVDEVNSIICNKVEKSMEEMLVKLSPLHEESCIYQVPKQQRDMNPKAYLPQLISIGPFHYNTQEELINNEHRKLRAFLMFLCRMSKNNPTMVSLEDILKAGTLKLVVEKSHCWMEQVWNSYASSINMTKEKFIVVMLVDSCFIIDFLTNRSFYAGIMFEIYHDLVKLENQVPFFLLQRLFDLLPNETKWSSDPHFSGLQHSIAGISAIFDGYAFSSTNRPKHFVDYLNLYFPSPLLDDMTFNMHEEKNSEKNSFVSNFIHKCFCAFWKTNIHCLKNNNKKLRKKKQFTPSVTELWEAGVTIMKAENPKFITDITFKSGVMEIPHLVICDNFEVIMRNLMAFEQLSVAYKNTCVIDYIAFLDNLISTENDVRLLVDVEVISNSIGGNDKEVSDLFNNLCRFVTAAKPSQYTKINNDLRKHCDGWWNRAKASLKHNYFNTPWAIISFIAATLLIILTILQTIFSAISAFPG